MLCSPLGKFGWLCQHVLCSTLTLGRCTLRRANSAVKFGLLARSVHSIYGDTLTTFSDPNALPLINGEEIGYHPDVVYRSPFVNSEYGRGIISITVRDETVELDLNG